MAVFERLFFEVAYPMRRIYWFVFRPSTETVKCLVVQNGLIMLARSNYVKQYWTVPGGRVKVRPPHEESPKAACKRILKNGIGIRFNSIEFLGTYQTNHRYLREAVCCFYARALDNEIRAVSSHHRFAWFRANKLPPRISPTVRHVLELYEKFNRANSS